MRDAGLGPDASDMADGPVTDGEVALKLVVAALLAAAVAAVVIWDPIVSLAHSLDLRGSISVPDVPDLPTWLMFLLGSRSSWRWPRAVGRLRHGREGEPALGAR
jgi:hypothetical protein